MAEIGEQGESFNVSSASRAANFQPDIDRVKQYDPYQQKYVKISRGIYAVGLLVLAGAIRLWTAGHGILAGVAGLLALLLVLGGYMVGRGAGAAIYASGLLIPAQITALEPLEIVAMANMNNDEDDDEPHYGLRRITLKELPLHALRLGERIPCAAAFGGSSAGGWGFFEPRPLVWATDDPVTITATIASIPEEEWLRLSQLTSQLPALEGDQIAFYGADLSFVTVK